MKLAVDRITKQYKNKIAVDRISFSLSEGVTGAFGRKRCRKDDAPSHDGGNP